MEKGVEVCIGKSKTTKILDERRKERRKKIRGKMRDLHGEDVVNDGVEVCLHEGSRRIKGPGKEKNDENEKEKEGFKGSEERKNKEQESEGDFNGEGRYEAVQLYRQGKNGNGMVTEIKKEKHQKEREKQRFNGSEKRKNIGQERERNLNGEDREEDIQ